MKHDLGRSTVTALDVGDDPRKCWLFVKLWRRVMTLGNVLSFNLVTFDQVLKIILMEVDLGKY
jgi:hypothetical protein